MAVPPEWKNVAQNKSSEILEDFASSFSLKAPVPIEEIIEEYMGGAHIITSLDPIFPDDVSAISQKDINIGWLIIINGREAPVRQRFSAAHELAHMTLPLHRSKVEYCSHHVGGWTEELCDEFAGHILMPAPLVQTYYKRAPNPSLREIATAFKVSKPVAEIELRYLDLPFRRDDY